MTSRGRGRTIEPNYRWVIEWDEQQVLEEIGGEIKRVTVIGGREYCVSWEGVERLVETLEKWWPGIKLRIEPVEKNGYAVQRSVSQAIWEQAAEADGTPGCAVKLAAAR